MDFINSVMVWLEANWGTAIFGGVSLGMVVTTTVLLVKQWLGNTKLGNSFVSALAVFDEKYTRLEKLYEGSVANAEEKDAQLLASQLATAVVFDGMAKLVLASKLDSEDKQSFIAGIEKYKLMNPGELTKKAKEQTEEVMDVLSDKTPVEVIANVASKTSNLLEKYTSKTKGE